MQLLFSGATKRLPLCDKVMAAHGRKTPPMSVTQSTKLSPKPASVSKKQPTPLPSPPTSTVASVPISAPTCAAKKLHQTKAVSQTKAFAQLRAFIDNLVLVSSKPGSGSLTRQTAWKIAVTNLLQFVLI